MKPTRILFIGNSFTSRYDLPRQVTELAAGAEHPVQVETRMIVAGGASLRRHWNAGIAQEAMASAAWDYVVLQEQSTLPLKNPKRYHENVRLFHEEIARRGPRTVLYLTWSRKSVPHAQADITRAVEEIAAEIGASIVPVGALWHSAMQANPQLDLYADDGSHPTPAGSYLAACTFFVSLFGQQPIGASVSDRLKIDPQIAAALREFAWAHRRLPHTPISV